MEKSIFIKRLEIEQPLTYAFIEVLGEVMSGDEEMEYGAALLEAMGRLGIDESALSKIADRLVEYHKKDDVDRPATSRVKGNSFGAGYLGFINDLSIADKCLFAADYDYFKAEQLYCNLDVIIVDQIVKTKINETFQAHLLHYEGTVYGMGGSFKSSARGSSSGGNFVDKDVKSRDLEARGFMAMMNKRV